ncbi:SUZ domain-containing protein 1-like [Xenia sp. Carnegie-2017]|uniref:SUZ domain-containing protein 1-like n=1 Tax=Xenia sp. Carnegie-2017 TaxID=2897299 RepID=UPI001F04459F|nr:SUZ domain-containing protein 1-like [Xenia sp. Carnegie-2017]
MAEQENDEDVWDSWEDMADSGELERRMEEREKEHMRLRDEIDKKLFDPGVRVLLDDDSNRTRYIPQVRILRRDPKESPAINSTSPSGESSNKKIHKTLAQREKEYADARARILGEEAADGSEDETCNEMKIKTDEKLPDNIIRQPRGPDGTNGFALKR